MTLGTVLATGLGYETLREATEQLFDRAIARETDLAEALHWCEERRGRRGYHRAVRVVRARGVRALEAVRDLDYALDRLAVWAREYARCVEEFRVPGDPLPAGDASRVQYTCAPEVQW